MRFILGGDVQYRAYFFAQMAVYTYFLVYLGIAEAFIVVLHRDALLGTGVIASPAAATVFLVLYLDHVYIGLSPRPI